MAYTFVHPGYALLVKKKWLKKLSINGLIWGSLVPDFDILFRFTASREHILRPHLFSIFIIILLCLSLSFYFHYVIKDIIINNLPKTKKINFDKLSNYDYLSFLQKNFFLEIFSIVIAASIHLVIDILSHWDAWTVTTIQQLIYPSRFLHPISYYFGWYFPQVFSTLLGIYFITNYFAIEKKDLQLFVESILHLPIEKKLYWIATMFFAFLTTLFLLNTFGYEGEGFGWHYLIIYSSASLIISFFTLPLFLKLKRVPYS